MSISDKEQIYRSKFSGFRFGLFLYIEKIYKFFINDNDQRMDVLIKIFNDNQPKTILEIGSGTLPVFLLLPQSYKNIIQYYVCEANFSKVEYIKKNFPEVMVFHSDALKLPFQNNFFDLVLSKGVLHHIDSENNEERYAKRLDFLLESKRVLKNGGMNLIMDFDYNPKRIKDWFWHNLYKIILYEPDHHFFNKTETNSLFDKAKYSSIVSNEFDTFKGKYYYVIGKK